jgi:isochorismate synthase
MITDSTNIDPLFDLTHFMNRRSFVVWRKPGASNHEGFTASIKIIPSDELPDQTAFVFSPFKENASFPKLAFHPEHSDSAESASYKNLFPSITFPTDKPDDESTYCDRIALLTSMMHNEELHKVVLSRRIDLNGPSEEMAPALFNELCAKYPAAFVSLVHIPGVFTWLGATPERLLYLKNNTVHTTSIAATRPFEGELPDIGNWNKKELEEQQLVTDFILDVLAEAGIMDIECDGPRPMQAGNLVHLKTDIRFKVTPQTDMKQLIIALHPTPAVCGLPKEKAFQTIQLIEPHSREYYAGYLGLIQHEELALYVNLRCMRWMDGKASLFVGGGITAASNPKEEWEETNFKALTLLNVIDKLSTLAGNIPNAYR